MSSSKNYIVSISIIGILFFIFGFITWTNGTLIPFLKLACNLQSDGQALLVTSAFYMAYFFLAIPSSFILNKTGYKKGMALGLSVIAVGALIFLPAASGRNFSLFLTGLFVQGMGLSLLQTASNPYISVIGPIESAAQRLSIMGVCNKVAGALAPVILSSVILKDANAIETKVKAATDELTRNELLQELSNRVVAPYIVMAIVLVLLALMIWFSSLPEIEADGGVVSDNSSSKSKTSIFQFPHLLLGALCIFMYVGVEVMTGDVIGTYGRSMGMSLDETKIFTSYTLWAMVVGYVIGIFTIPKFIKQETALKICAIIGVAFMTASFFAQGYTSIFFVAIAGLANSLMWPAIFGLALDGLGRFTKIGSALLVMGISGGAVVPKIYGELVATIPSQTAFFVCTAPCYLYILYYSMKGHNAGKKSLA